MDFILKGTAMANKLNRIQKQKKLEEKSEPKKEGPPSEQFSRNKLEKPLEQLQKEKKKKLIVEEDSERKIPVTKKVIAKKGEIIVRPTIMAPAVTDFRNPIEEMANAFKANAQALELIQQQQMDLTESLERSRVERSQMVVKSNEALNETFKQLQTIQEQVIDKIDHEKTKSNRTVVALSIASATLVVFILLGILLSQQKDLQNHKKDIHRAMQEVYSTLATSHENSNVSTTIPQDSITMQEALAQLKAAYEGRARDSQNEILELKRQLGDKEQELRQLRAQIAQFQQMETTNDNTVVEDLRQKDDEKQKVISELAQQLFKMRQEIDQMKTDRAQNPSNTNPLTQDPKTTITPIPSTETKAESFLKRLNTLLENNPQSGRYQILKIGNVDRQQLQNIEIAELGPQGNPLKKYTAEKCILSLVPDEGKIIFELQEVRILLITQNNRVIRLSSQNLELFQLDWKQWWQYNEEIITLK